MHSSLSGNLDCAIANQTLDEELQVTFGIGWFRPALYFLNQLFKSQPRFAARKGFDDRTLGELIWTISHQNITTFLKDIPAERQARIQFEQLVSDPETVWRGVCTQIGIPYHDGLVQPYQNRERKMVDGIHKESVPMGDTHFLDHGRINPDRGQTGAARLSSYNRQYWFRLLSVMQEEYPLLRRPALDMQLEDRR